MLAGQRALTQPPQTSAEAALPGVGHVFGEHPNSPRVRQRSALSDANATSRKRSCVLIKEYAISNIPPTPKGDFYTNLIMVFPLFGKVI